MKKRGTKLSFEQLDVGASRSELFISYQISNSAVAIGSNISYKGDFIPNRIIVSLAVEKN